MFHFCSRRCQMTSATVLRGNKNLFLSNNCSRLTGVSVKITVTKDLVWKSSSGQYKGFSFQLNCWSLKGYVSAWQQFCIAVYAQSGSVELVTNQYQSSFANGFIDNADFVSAGKLLLPAGHQIKIALNTRTFDSDVLSAR